MLGKGGKDSWRFDWSKACFNTHFSKALQNWRTQDVDHGSQMVAVTANHLCQEHSTHHGAASCFFTFWLCKKSQKAPWKTESISGFSQLSIQLNLSPNPGEHQLVFADSFPSEMVKHKLWSIAIQYIICHNIPITYHSKLPRKMDVHPLKTLNVFEFISFRQYRPTIICQIHSHIPIKKHCSNMYPIHIICTNNINSPIKI